MREKDVLPENFFLKNLLCGETMLDKDISHGRVFLSILKCVRMGNLNRNITPDEHAHAYWQGPWWYHRITDCIGFWASTVYRKGNRINMLRSFLLRKGRKSHVVPYTSIACVIVQTLPMATHMWLLFFFFYDPSFFVFPPVFHIE